MSDAFIHSNEVRPPTQPIRILIVEDEVLIAFGAMAELEAAGFEVSLCADGRSGLSAATEQDFDLIITDYMMPKMDGLQMISAIRACGRTTPIVLTSAIRREQLPRPQDLGYDAFLSKPYRGSDICELARNLSTHSDEHEEQSYGAHRSGVRQLMPC